MPPVKNPQELKNATTHAASPALFSERVKQAIPFLQLTKLEKSPTPYLATQKTSYTSYTYYKEQSTANSNSFKIAQKTAFEAKGRLYTTGKVLPRLFIIDLHTQLAIYSGYR